MVPEKTPAFDKRTIVGQKSCCWHPAKTTEQGNRHKTVFHTFHLAGTTYKRRKVCCQQHWPYVQVVLLRLIDAFDAVDALDFADVGEDGFELAAIDDFEIHIDLRVLSRSGRLSRL